MKARIKSWFIKEKPAQYKCPVCRDFGVIKKAKVILYLEGYCDGSLYGTFIQPEYNHNWEYIDCPAECENVVKNEGEK